VKIDFLPKNRLGKWSVGLNTFFLIVIVSSLLLVKILGILSFNDTWWDVTVLVFILSIAAFILGVIAIRKNKESSSLVYASVIVGLISILFLLLHSLFIND